MQKSHNTAEEINTAPTRLLGGFSEYPDDESSLGKYIHLIPIGEGGGGKVYKAYDPDLERWVALKVLNNGVLASKEIKKRFFKEIKTQARLNVPGTARVFECGEDKGWLFYTMELIIGISLRKYNAQLSAPLAGRLQVIMAASRIIANLHKQKIAHCDIKSENIILDEFGDIKLLDFGLASSIAELQQDDQDDTFGIGGSLGYMAPEIFDGDNTHGAASDVYSLSVLAFETLTGKLPYDIDFLSFKEIAEVVKTEPPEPLKLPRGEELDLQVEQIIMRGLNVDLKKRPSAKELAETMENALPQDILTHEPPPRKRGWLMASATALVAVAIVYAFTFKSVQKPTNLPPSSKTLPAKDSSLSEKAALTGVALTQPPGKNKKTIAPANIVLFKNSYPPSLRNEWKSCQQELNGNLSLRSNGALYFSLPSKALLTVKSKGKIVLDVDSKFQKAGCVYHPAGQELLLEFSRGDWSKAAKIKWRPVKGRVDVFFPNYMTLSQINELTKKNKGE